MSFFIFLLLLIGVAVVFFIYYYNKFVKLKNQAEESLSDIDVQLKRRYDLIPNIVETVKGYASHEKDTLQKVIEARNFAQKATAVSDKAIAENMLSGALKNLFALSESYPELKANQNFLDLQKTLSEIEDNLQLARRYYNAVVRDFNILCEAFPSVVIANMFGFKKKDFFEIEEKEKENVKVSF